MRRGGPIQRKERIPARRVIARVKDRGRVKHERVKTKSTSPTAEQDRFSAWLPDVCQGCGVCGGTVRHHLLANADGKERRRDHWFIVRLCPDCHNMGTDSVHLLGSEAAFKAKHGVDLVVAAVRNLLNWKTRDV